jgi:hypothetical protein
LLRLSFGRFGRLALPQNGWIFCGIERILLYHRAPSWLKRGCRRRWRTRLTRGNVKLNARVSLRRWRKRISVSSRLALADPVSMKNWLGDGARLVRFVEVRR